MGEGRKLTIALSTVLSVIVFTLVVSGAFVLYRRRQRRLPFLGRGITPIDDDEIETWKTGRTSEKHKANHHRQEDDPRGWSASEKKEGHVQKPSLASTRTGPASVIVYKDADTGVPRASEDFSPSSYTSTGLGQQIMGRISLDNNNNNNNTIPQSPAQAMAPNARAGLTDATIPGDPSFLPRPRRNTSRLSKAPPTHARTRSSRSSVSMRSFYYAGSDMELQLSPRGSNDYHRASNPQQHARMYSSSSIPPRLSLNDDVVVSGLSPRPLFRDDIGRAIG